MSCLQTRSSSNHAHKDSGCSQHEKCDMSQSLRKDERDKGCSLDPFSSSIKRPIYNLCENPSTHVHAALSCAVNIHEHEEVTA